MNDILRPAGKSAYLENKKVDALGVLFVQRGLIILISLVDRKVEAITGKENISQFFRNEEYKNKERYSFLYLKPGTICIPMFDDESVIYSLQIIFESGKKRFLKESRKSGLSYWIGGTPAPSKWGAPVILIAEGFSTAASLHMATGLPVVVAFDAGNLPSVVEGVAKKFPGAMVVICCDDDSAKKDAGLKKGKQAAEETGSQFILPDFSSISSDKKMSEVNK